jgi:hypothetical protein
MWPQPRRSSRKRSDIKVMRPYDHPDRYAASHRAVREMQNADMLPKSTKLGSSKYLNNLVEQDTAASNPELVPCSVSRTSTPPPSPLPESNCFTVSVRDCSHSADSNSKIKLRRRSGTQFWLHKSHLSSSTSLRPLYLFASEPDETASSRTGYIDVYCCSSAFSAS